MGARGLDPLEQGPPSPVLGDTGTVFLLAGRGCANRRGQRRFPTRGSVPQILVSEFSDSLHRFFSKR